MKLRGERQRDRQAGGQTDGQTDSGDRDTAGDRRDEISSPFLTMGGNRLKSGEQREEFNCFHLVIIISKKPHERENLCFLFIN